MEVRLRLQKAGSTSKGKYNYRIVAMNRTSARDSKYLDIIGHYDSAKKPAVISVNKEKLEKWLKKGATLSDTVKSLIKKIK